MIEVADVEQAIDIWSKQLDFTLNGVVRHKTSGVVVHAFLTLDDVSLMVGSCEDPERAAGGGAISFYIHPERDVDAYFERVRSQPDITVTESITDQWWGDRSFSIIDSLGFRWHFARSVGESQLPDDVVWEESATAAR